MLRLSVRLCSLVFLHDNFLKNGATITKLGVHINWDRDLDEYENGLSSDMGDLYLFFKVTEITAWAC